MRVAYLGPPGTFSDEALQQAAAGKAVEPMPAPSVFAALAAVDHGECELALVPFENSIEGSVRSTLDALAFDLPGLVIVGEHDHEVRHSLIARRSLEPGEVTVVLSHQQVNAQCARFLRTELPGAEVRAVSSSADAVRQVAEGPAGWAALGTAAAADRYGCVVVRSGVEDEPDNVTRFVWVSREPREDDAPTGPRRTTLAFSELADHPGALVALLGEFASRGVNLTRIESRPLRQGLGRYLFFVDLVGGAGDPAVADALAAVRTKAATVRVLGSYGAGPPTLPDAGC